MSNDEFRGLRRAADYQFGGGGGTALFAGADALDVTHTSSGRRDRSMPRMAGSLRTATTGAFGSDSPAGADSSMPSTGRDTAWSSATRASPSSVRAATPSRSSSSPPTALSVRATKPRRPRGRLSIAVGRAELPGSGMDDFETGMAVKVRQGAED